MKLRSKILLFVLTTSIVIFIASIGYVSYNYRSMAMSDARKIAESYSMQSGFMAKSILNVDLSVAKTIQQTFLGYDKIPKKERKKIYDEILKNVLRGNPDYISVWDSWTLDVLDSAWDKPYGRVRTAFYKQKDGGISVRQDTVEVEGEAYGSLYYSIKTGAYDEVITEPYFFPYVKGDSVLEVSITMRMVKESKFYGIVGIDVPLYRFQSIAEKMIPFEKSYVFILSNAAKIIAHPNKSYIGHPFTNFYQKIDYKYNITEKIQKGESFSLMLDSLIQDTTAFVLFAPIQVGKTNTPWSVGMVIPVNVIMKQANENFSISVIASIIGMILLAIVIWIISKNITKPLLQTTEILKTLSSGMINKTKKLEIETSDEIGEMGKSVNTLIDTLNNMTDFAKKIGQGDLNAQYKIASEYDILGGSLLEMRKNLIQAKEDEELRKVENQKISWAQEGITMIGEILRLNYESLEQFSYNIISSLVKFLNANQGGFYLINENESGEHYIELLASYAYDRKKMLEAKIAIGENLVGRAVMEKELVQINNLPDGYVFISSGLGERTPECLLISPLVSDEESFGAIEVASFKNFETHEIEFIKRVSERIASSVSNIKKNTRTSELLKQSQKQSEELAEREKEMIENLKELQLIQEEALRKELETAGILDAISATAAVVYYDMNGVITFINDKNLDDLGISREEIIGHNQAEFAPEAREKPEEYRKFWDDLRAGRQRKRLFYMKKGNVEKWLMETYTPILNKEGKPHKIINIGIDISDNKLNEKKIKELQSELMLWKSTE